MKDYDGGVSNFHWRKLLATGVWGLGNGSPSEVQGWSPSRGLRNEITQKLKQFADTVCRVWLQKRPKLENFRTIHALILYHSVSHSQWRAKRHIAGRGNPPQSPSPCLGPPLNDVLTGAVLLWPVHDWTCQRKNDCYYCANVVADSEGPESNSQTTPWRAIYSTNLWQGAGISLLIQQQLSNFQLVLSGRNVQWRISVLSKQHSLTFGNIHTLVYWDIPLETESEAHIHVVQWSMMTDRVAVVITSIITTSNDLLETADCYCGKYLSQLTHKKNFTGCLTDPQAWFPADFQQTFSRKFSRICSFIDIYRAGSLTPGLTPVSYTHLTLPTKRIV